MKKNIHPDNYRLVVFKDTSCDYAFLTRSTVETKETIKWDDGNEYTGGFKNGLFEGKGTMSYKSGNKITFLNCST